MNAQIIEKNGRPEWAVIPYADYERIMDRLDTLQDIADADAAKLVIENGEDEGIPGEVVNRLFSGESRLKVWREFRGLTQAQLAQAANLAQATIAQMESGKRTGSMTVLKRLAQALRVDLDDLA
ncbi:MAG: XRE family transcriptional regulator [Methylococcaceae bacterium]|nr:MAG: XRE family transcriptional regulator [Methylococcaceae bacterium]